MRHLDWITDKIKEKLMVSNSLPFILQSRYQAHFGKALFWKNVLYVAFVCYCLISTTQSQRYWEIKRENGIIETCCFCRHRDLKNREHIIKECEVKFGNVNILGFTGPPICSCLSSKKYPQCLDSHNVCGKNIDCPNNKVYESCNIKKLLTLKTMICNDSLQWEHDIDCNATCMPSNDIKNGIAGCQMVGNKVVCNCTCKEGFVTSQTRNLSCIEAKNTICNPVKTKQYLLEIFLPIGIGIVIIISIILYCIWKKTIRLPRCFGNVPHGNVQNDVPNGNVPNGNVPNGFLRNGNIAQESNHIQRDEGLNSTPGDEESSHTSGAEVSNHTPRDEESIYTPEDEETNHTPGAQESNHIQRDEGLNSTPWDEESSHTSGAEVSNHTPRDEESIYTPEDEETNHTPGAQESNHIQRDEGLNSTPWDEESSHTSGAEVSNHTPRDEGLNHTLGAQESNQTQIDQPTNCTPEGAESLRYADEYQSMGFPSFPESLQHLPHQEIEMEPLLSKHEMEPQYRPKHESEIRLSEEETGRPNFQE